MKDVVDYRLNLDTETVDRAHAAEPLCVEPLTPVREIFQLLKTKNRGAVLVCREGRLVGIFTERDALKLMAEGADLDIPVERVMAAEPEVLHETDTVGAAVAKMAFGGYRRLPIVDDQGRPKGVLKVSGILHYLVGHFPTVVYTLPPAPHHSTQTREGP